MDLVVSCSPRRSFPGNALPNLLLAPIRKMVKCGFKKLGLFPFKNALQTLTKTLFGSSCGLACGQHTGRKSPEIRARCYSAVLQYCMRPSMRPYGCLHEIPDLVFSSPLRATVLLQYHYSARTQKRRFRCRFRPTLRCRAPWASLMPVTRNKPIKP